MLSRQSIKRYILGGLLLPILGILGYGQVEDKFPEQVRVTGHCTKESYTSEGPVGADLTKHQTPFACDTAIIAFLDHEDKHVRVQFVNFKSKTRELGFDGVMDDEGQIMGVVHIYRDREKSILATEGACKFFFQKPTLLERGTIKGVGCGAKLDSGNHRYVQIVAFDADPGQ